MNKLDDQKTVLLHKTLIENKHILRKIYESFYHEFKDTKIPRGKVLELGSGGGFIKKIIPRSITSDVVKGPGIDKVFLAEKMPFKNNTLSAIFMLNVFHHIKNPTKALREMERCLKKGGKIVMIEPYNSVWSKFVYTNFHHELFDPTLGWKVPGKGRLSDANDALPWIVFVRDRRKFESKFPNLRIDQVIPHTPFLYILSGGLSRKQLIPSFFYRTILYMERILSPLNKYIGLFVTIKITKLS